MQCIFHVRTHKTIIAAGTNEQLYIMIKIYIHSFIHGMLEVQPIYLKFPFFSCTAPQHEIDKPPVITGYLHFPPIIVSKERSFLLFQTISSSSTISSSLTSHCLLSTPPTSTLIITISQLSTCWTAISDVMISEMILVLLLWHIRASLSSSPETNKKS